MRIPFWIWIIIGLTAISWAVPDGIPGEEFVLPALAIGSLLLRRMFMRNSYQQQYQQYQQQGKGAYSGQGSTGSGAGYKTYTGTGFHGYSGAGTRGQGPQGTGSQGAGSQGAGSFYSRFRNWGSGFQQGFGQPPTSAKDPYVILGVRQGASMEEIRKAYREKLKKYHPDIVANLKLGEEYKEMFEEKTREIQFAYEQLGGK